MVYKVARKNNERGKQFDTYRDARRYLDKKKSEDPSYHAYVWRKDNRITGLTKMWRLEFREYAESVRR